MAYLLVLGAPSRTHSIACDSHGFTRKFLLHTAIASGFGLSHTGHPNNIFPADPFSPVPDPDRDVSSPVIFAAMSMSCSGIMPIYGLYGRGILRRPSSSGH